MASAPISDPPLMPGGTGYPGHPPRDFLDDHVPRGLEAHGRKEGDKVMEGNGLFLVTVSSDLRVQRLLWRSASMVSYDATEG